MDQVNETYGLLYCGKCKDIVEQFLVSKKERSFLTYRCKQSHLNRTGVHKRSKKPLPLKLPSYKSIFRLRKSKDKWNSYTVGIP
jgi:hypothetical protein